MRAHHIRITRTARFYTLGAPGASTTELWVLAHGYGQLAAEFLRTFNVLDDGARLLVAPEALNRFYTIPVKDTRAADRPVGATWMTREDREHEIEDYVGYLDALVAELSRQIARPFVLRALGFSQGVATIARWCALGNTRVDELICWAGLLPPDLDLALLGRRLGPRLLRLVVGDRDGFVADSALEQQEERLSSHGIRYEVTRFAGGHRLSRAVLEEIAREPVSPSAGAPDR